MAYKTVIEKLPPGPDIDLLLMGKTGHGKSVTGNSILGRRAFRTTDTTSCKIGYSRIDERVIKVVDIPGLCDTEGNDEEVTTDRVVRSISNGLSQFPQGLTALILVLRYTRFTKEEREAVATLKEILGEDIIKKHTICIVTHGDDFKREHGENFEAWCRSRETALKELFEECQFRCVLFDNSTKDPQEKRGQLINLVSIMDGFGPNDSRYTFEKFTAKSGDDKKLPIMLEKFSRRNGLIIDDLDKMIDENVDDNSESILRLKQNVQNLKNEVDENDDEMFSGIKRGVDDVWAKVSKFETALQEEKWSIQRREIEREKAAMQQRRPEGGKWSREVARMSNETKQRHSDLLKELRPLLDITDEKVTETIEKTGFAQKIRGFFHGLGEKFFGWFD